MKQEILDKFKMGYFILYRNDNSIFGNLIVKRQLVAGFTPDDANYIHVEISGGEIHSINISPPISKLVDITKAHKGRFVRLCRYKGYNGDGKRYKVAYFSASLCNKGYDVSGILAFLFRWVKQSNRLWFCSEGTAWALSMVFLRVFGDLTPDKIMPAHFLDDKFEIVWQGVIE